MTAATDSSLASLLVADSPSHNTSTQTTVFIGSSHRLPPATDDSPQSFYKHTTHISYHSGETLRSVRHPRFHQPQDDMTGLQSSRLPTNGRQHTASRDHLPRSKQSTTAHCLDPGGRLRSTFQAIDDSRQSSSSKQSTRAQSLRLPSNRRQHKVFVFQAIDDSRQSSSSRQSTSRKHKVFVFQAIDERSSTNTLTSRY